MSKPDKGRMDGGRIGALLAQAREELGLKRAGLAPAFAVSARTVLRWESGEAIPARSQRRLIASALANAEGETWRALVAALELPLDAMLYAVPAQRAKITPATPATPARASDAHAVLDDAVRSYAEDLDVSARRLRVVLTRLLGAIETLGLSPAKARELVAQRADAGGPSA